MRAIFEILRNNSGSEDADNSNAILDHILEKDFRGCNIRAIRSFAEDGIPKIKEYLLTEYYYGDYRKNDDQIKQLRSDIDIVYHNPASALFTAIYDDEGEILHVIIYIASL